MSDTALSVDQIWVKTVDTVKDRVSSMSLWETLEKSHAITIEDGVLIVGLNSRDFNHAGHLNISENRNAIEKAASFHAGRPLTMRVIEGENHDDWVFTKKRDERVAALKVENYARQDKQSDEAQSWDALLDKIAKSFSATQNRSLPQTKARFLTEMLYLITDAMETLYPDDRDESTERHLARILEKVAGCTSIPAPMVSLEIDRLRAWKKRQT
jgi:hypothetical protein